MLNPQFIRADHPERTDGTRAVEFLPQHPPSGVNAIPQ
jgi:hypothetical protein